MFRPICAACNQRQRAINYYSSNGVPHFRSRCEICNRKNKKAKPPVPRWQLKGYKKKPTCDLCGFKSKYQSQILVYHVDGNLNNANLRNLKSVCLNCVVTLKFTDLSWRPGDLEEDL